MNVPQKKIVMNSTVAVKRVAHQNPLNAIVIVKIAASANTTNINTATNIIITVIMADNAKS